MPLLVLCGLPGSGKTKAAERILALRPTSLIISCKSLNHPSDCAKQVTSEKNCRASLLAACERNLGTDTTRLVLLDACNQVKGFRYQLWCLARSLKTSYAVLYLPGGGESGAVVMERPDAADRWDCPLFHYYGNEAELMAVVDALCDAKERTLPKPTPATSISLETKSVSLQPIYQALSQAVIQRNQTFLKHGIRIDLSGFTTSKVQRARQTFMQVLKMRPIEDQTELERTFLEYLNKAPI